MDTLSATLSIPAVAAATGRSKSALRRYAIDIPGFALRMGRDWRIPQAVAARLQSGASPGAAVLAASGMETGR